MKVTTTVVIGMTALLAGDTIWFALTLAHVTPTYRMVATGAASLVIAHGLSALRVMWSKTPATEWWRRVDLLGGMALIALGSAATVWSVHLGLTTGDWEGYGPVRGLLIALQGALSVHIVVPNIRLSQPD